MSRRGAEGIFLHGMKVRTYVEDSEVNERVCKEK